MPQDALDDLRAVDFASAPNDLHSRVCLEPLREVGFGKLPGGQGEKRCRCVDLGRSHTRAIELREQERRDQRNPLVAIMKWMILCDPKGERGSEVVVGGINFISRLILAAIERGIEQVSIAYSRETTMLGEGLHMQHLNNTWQNEAPRTNRSRRNCGCLRCLAARLTGGLANGLARRHCAHFPSALRYRPAIERPAFSSCAPRTSPQSSHEFTDARAGMPCIDV